MVEAPHQDAGVNPAAATRIGNLLADNPTQDALSALAVMDTRLAAPALEIGIMGHSAGAHLLYSADPGPFSEGELSASLLLPAVQAARFARVTSHGDGTSTLTAQNLAGDFNGDGPDEVGTVAAVSENGYAVVTNNLLLPAVQAFHEAATDTYVSMVRLIAFNDVYMQTDNTTTTELVSHFYDVSGDGLVVPTDVLLLWDSTVAGSEDGSLNAQLFIDDGETTDTLLNLTGTPSDVAAELRALGAFPIPALPLASLSASADVTGLALTLQYTLNSLDGGLVWFHNSSGLIQLIPEPAAATLLLLAATALLARQRRREAGKA